MILLHAADLHLGKTLHERDLLEDQAAMLEGLLAALRTHRPAALLLAGDLYDRAIPTPEAIALFDSFLSRAAAESPGLQIIAIPGNHDSAARLSFGSGLLRRAGLHFRTRPEEFLEPVLVEAAGERLAVWALPFLGSGARLGPAEGEGEESGLRSQAELFSAALAALQPRLLPRAYNVLLAHCFAGGGTASESERAFVGLAEEVDAGLFDPFDYAALGHLHRPQAAGRKGRYPGSPLCYSFAEAARPDGGERGFLRVELLPGEARVEFLPFRPRRRLVRVEGSFAELLLPGARAEYREDYVEVRLLDLLPVLDPAEALKRNFPWLLTVRQAAFEIRPPEASPPPAPGDAIETGGAAALLRDFSAFYAEMKGAPPDEASLALVAELAKEAETASA